LKITVWVPETALSAVLGTETTIMGRWFDAVNTVCGTSTVASGVDVPQTAITRAALS